MKTPLLCMLTSTVLFFFTDVTMTLADEFDSLIEQIPRSANAILLIDAAGLRQSTLGKSQKWGDKNEAAFVKGATYLPPEAARIVVGSQLNPNQQFKMNWQVAAMALSDPMSARSIARAEGGTIDEINGRPAVWSPADAYFHLPSETTLSLYTPANRQAVARWSSSSKSQSLSPFLSKSITLEEGQQIVMAIDLKDAVMPFQLEQKLGESDLVPEAKRSVWQNIVESIEGIKLSIHVTDKIEAELIVSFGSDPSELSKQAKAALQATLENYGVAIESIDNWTVSISGNNLFTQGELSSSDFRKVMSLLELPNSNFSQLAQTETSDGSNFEEVVKASQKYFSTVSSLLNDLENEFHTNVDARRYQSATYMQRYAKRIDNLPIVNVDADLVDFGLTVSDSLRDSSVSERNAAINAGVRKSRIEGGVSYNYYDGYRTTASLRTQVNREEQSVAKKDRFNNWKEIQDGMSQIRVEMTRKYNVEF